MKKFWIMALALMLAAVLTAACGWAETASVTTYHMTDIGISVDLDSDIPVYRAGDQEISEAYTGLGFTKEYMDNLMAENKLSLHALIKKGSRELTINSVDPGIEDFDKQSEEALEVLRANTAAQFTAMGAEVRDSAYVDTGLGKALYIHYSYKSGIYTNHMIQYSVLKEQRMVNLRMSSYNGWPNREDEEWLLQVLNSLKWEKRDEAEVVLPEGSVTYHVEGAKLSIELPAALPVYGRGDAEVNAQYKIRDINKQAMDQMMEENDIYLHSLINFGSELFVISAPLEAMVPEEVTEEERGEMLKMMKLELENAGTVVTGYDLVDTAPGRAFHFIFSIIVDGITQECEQYTLLRQGSIVNVRAVNYSGGLTGEEKALLLDAVNSIRWDE